MGPRYGAQQQMQFGGGFVTSFSDMQGGGFRNSFGYNNFSGMRGGGSGMRGGRGAGGGGGRGAGGGGGRGASGGVSSSGPTTAEARAKPADSAAKPEQPVAVGEASASGSGPEQPAAAAKKPEEPVPSVSASSSAKPAAAGVEAAPSIKVEVSLILRSQDIHIFFHFCQN
jgi:hypothetical protein